MDLVERDAVELQPPCAGTLALFDDRRERRDRHDLAGHRHLGALVAECLAQNPLALAQAVHLGGVEQRDPEGEGAANDVMGRAGGVTVPVTPLARAELPSA